MSNVIAKALRKINNSYWLRSGSYTFMNKIFITLFAFLNFYILIRVLPREDFGAWVLFLSVASLMELIKHGFVRNPLIRFLAMSHQEESPGIQTASLMVNALVGFCEVFLLWLSAVYLSEFWSAPQLRSLFMIYMISTVLLIPLNHFDVIQQARMQFKGTFLSNFVRQAGLFVYVIVAFVFGLRIRLEHLAYAQTIGIFVSLFVSFKYARPFLQFSWRIRWDWLKQLYSYGIFTFGTNVSSMILKSIDSWMVGKLISPAAVTIFNPAVRISNLVEVPTDTLTSILFPKLSERLAKEGPEAGRYLYEKAVGTIAAFMLPVVLFIILFANPLVKFISGPGFGETVPILQVTMLYGLIIPFNRFFGITLDAVGKAKTNFLLVFASAIMNVFSNYFYIRNFGTIGAAYGTLTTYLFMLVYNQAFLHKHMGVRLRNILRHFIGAYTAFFSRGAALLRSFS